MTMKTNRGTGRSPSTPQRSATAPSAVPTHPESTESDKGTSVISQAILMRPHSLTADDLWHVGSRRGKCPICDASRLSG